MLTIITVGYQEESNLPKLYASLSWLRENGIQHRIVYVDQESTDGSIAVAKNWGAEIFEKPNKGYADPDKKWAVDTIAEPGDWILIADADFQFTAEFWVEATSAIESGDYEAVSIFRNVYFMGSPGISVRETVLFKKGAVELTENIHKYYEVRTGKVYRMKSQSICDDYKERGRCVSVWLKRIDKYTDIEAAGMEKMPKWKILGRIAFSPILWFFGYGILHKQFLNGIPGLINCLLNSFYRIALYAKVFEINYASEKSNSRP